MKITILDGHAVNPGDLSWGRFSELAEVTVYERTPSELVINRIGDSDAIFLNKINITEEILSHCPNLKYIGVLATGYNVVDLEACRKRGITVTNIPAYSTDSVAQHVFAFILHFTHSYYLHYIILFSIILVTGSNVFLCSLIGPYLYKASSILFTSFGFQNKFAVIGRNFEYTVFQFRMKQ